MYIYISKILLVDKKRIKNGEDVNLQNCVGSQQINANI
jgi:hypothetical protein